MDITNVEIKGRVTEVEVAVGLNTTAAELFPWSIALRGVGRAKCRRDDHWQDEIGLGIAAARAAIDLNRQIEENLCNLAKTELEFVRSENTDLRDILAATSDLLREIGRKLQSVR